MEKIVYFYPDGHAAHFEPGHPERPERVETLKIALQAAGYWDPFPKIPPFPVPTRILRAVHSPIYLGTLQAAASMGEHLDWDTYTTPASWDLALRSAGGAVAVASAVWEGQAQRGFALTRPPGHHAQSTRGMGFCLLNNVALAAEYLLSEKGAQRLAIIDLDLHHGNGVQEIFWQRAEVFYMSVHQWPLFPGTGSLQEVGSGPGEGFNANFPLPPGSGDQAFCSILDELILPLLDRYQPEMLLVSFGFDPHWRDPLGHLLLSAGVYNELIARLAAWADHNCAGRIALFLEGGYDLDAGKACGTGAAAALLGEPFEDPLGLSPHSEGNSWRSVVRQAHEIWRV